MMVSRALREELLGFRVLGFRGWSFKVLGLGFRVLGFRGWGQFLDILSIRDGCPTRERNLISLP